MRSLLIEETGETPKINFSPESNTFKISGKSLPENAIEFYEPVFDWLNGYSNTPNENSAFDFNLEYFNTASAKQIGKLLIILKKVANNGDLIVRWHYEEEDVGMLSSGRRYEKLIKLNFEYIPH